MMTAKKRKRHRRPLPVVLEAAEVEALLEVPKVKTMTGMRNRVALELMYRGALRVSEICSLKRSHIRWETPAIEVRNGKGGRDRVIPVDAETLHWLRLWDERRAKGPHYFFTRVKRFTGGKTSPRYWQRVIKRYAVTSLGPERAEVVTPHVLRHSGASHWLEQGLTVAEVSALLGHANVATTSVYLHANPRHIAEKIQGLRGETDAELAAKVRDALNANWDILGVPPEARNVLDDLVRRVLEHAGRK